MNRRLLIVIHYHDFGGSLNLTKKVIPIINIIDPKLQIILNDSPYRNTLTKYPHIIDVNEKVVIVPKSFVNVNADIHKVDPKAINIPENIILFIKIKKVIYL